MAKAATKKAAPRPAAKNGSKGGGKLVPLHDRIVIHWRRGDGHVYLVDDGSTVYRYSTSPMASAALSTEVEATLVLPG